MTLAKSDNIKYPNVKMWVDEAIWGHRFYDDQTPWFVMLEFLAVFKSRMSDNMALQEPFGSNNQHEEFEYSINKYMILRELIFNNPRIKNIVTSEKMDHECWNKWMENLPTYVGKQSYKIKDNFDKFSNLANIIEFFYATSIEPNNKRRWTSKFIFPYGPECIYADLSLKHSPDRRFFGRGGELLYLMLNRSRYASDIKASICNNILHSNDKWNRIVKDSILPVDKSEVRVSSDIGYLPLENHGEYDKLSETWKNILDLNLPGQVLLAPLVRLTALHLLRYMISRSNEVIGSNESPKFVLYISSPHKSNLLELSADNLKANRQQSLRAVLAYIESAKNTIEWKEANKSSDGTAATKSYLEKFFRLKEGVNHLLDNKNPEQMISEIKEGAATRHMQHFANIHGNWCKDIGLSCRRHGSAIYSPNDHFLKALVMCTGEKRMEYSVFLKTVYQTFGIVIGASEAEEEYNKLPCDQNIFIQNSERLEQRLHTLGIFRRLSDDCGYVENPFI